MKKILTLLACTFALHASAQRTVIDLSGTWQFSRDSVQWTDVKVPHDWAISGPFDKKHDLQFVAIEQNGETEKTEKSGRSGALPWIGRGFYHRTVNVDRDFNFAELRFEGAMSQPTVYVNGKKAGYWAYGYNAFNVDITKYLHKGENTIDVALTNVEESSRWYPGGGIYRPLSLVLVGNEKNKARIVDWGTFVTTQEIKDDGHALMHIEVQTVNAEGLKLVVYTQTKGFPALNYPMEPEGNGKYSASLWMKGTPWTPETPALKELCVELVDDNGKIVDSYQTKFGIRTVKVSKEGGFQLNGKTRKLKGVCLHHDLGPLGAAVNKAAIARQLLTMKEMGCNAIRTSHNMPSQWQMDLCDSLGLMVMVESFDMWIYPKCANGYAKFFKEWSDRDIENMVLANRNHPSVVMWSIGNEIPEQWSEEGREIARHLQDICHKFDPSRPVTQGMDRAPDALKSGFAQVMDVPGFNYRVHLYGENIKQLPKGFLLGSETCSTVSSRGVYKFPVEISDGKTYPDGQCSSYDVEYCSWSNLPDDDWVWQDDYPWVIGEFVWTGYDYLGEPTPYDEYWPSRSSYFGICDLAGLPKDRFYLYRSHWNKEKHTIHLLPHWNWPGREGQVTPVYCYTDYDEAELFVNGKSQGRIHKQKGQRLDRYRLRWNDVKYEPGEVRVVVYDDQGRMAGTTSIRTAGDPKMINLSADRTALKANADDLAFITVSLVDENGVMVPTADDLMEFSVSGNGSFKATCNGDATSLMPFTEPKMTLFSGQLVVVVAADKGVGKMTLHVKCPKRNLEKDITIDVI